MARMGGRAAHQKGTAHEFSSEEAREAGRKGGRAVSQNRDHMSAIGRGGGESRAASFARTGGARNDDSGPDEPPGRPPDGKRNAASDR